MFACLCSVSVLISWFFLPYIILSMMFDNFVSFKIRCLFSVVVNHELEE